LSHDDRITVLAKVSVQLSGRDEALIAELQKGAAACPHCRRKIKPTDDFLAVGASDRTTNATA
jgi:hypothetical protein